MWTTTSVRAYWYLLCIFWPTLFLYLSICNWSNWANKISIIPEIWIFIIIIWVPHSIVPCTAESTFDPYFWNSALYFNAIQPSSSLWLSLNFLSNHSKALFYCSILYYHAIEVCVSLCLHDGNSGLVRRIVGPSNCEWNLLFPSVIMQGQSLTTTLIPNGN